MTRFCFESSYLKIRRAQHHIKEFELAIRSFIHSDFLKIYIERDPTTGGQLIKLVSVSPMPTEIPLIIGDAVHNMRCALDHAMVNILGKEGSSIAFPLAKDQANPSSHPTYKILKEKLPLLASLLTDSIGIHDTGGPCLWSISALDNIDKHNLLIATASVQTLRNIQLVGKNGSGPLTVGSVRINGGTTFNLGKFIGYDVELATKPEPDVLILFGKGQPLEGHPVRETLVKLAEFTISALKMLEQFCADQHHKNN